MEEIKENGLKIFKAIFDGSKTVDIESVEYRLQSFSSGIKYLDLFGYRFIEQNRMKPSEWGKKAREGHKIVWIIRGRQYIARIMDGEYTALKKT